ncbi:unnamed protein product [Brugia pahangi]|uniref:Ovule protein n=1 Tax=Brugia pahangi TaxID=6280 RepID=A0A0N4SZF4_BRUPA|nr:unnamed protein product [Brugia pahangi]
MNRHPHYLKESKPRLSSHRISFITSQLERDGNARHSCTKEVNSDFGRVGFVMGFSGEGQERWRSGGSGNSSWISIVNNLVEPIPILTYFLCSFVLFLRLG